jgi:hypothetical protein
MFKQWMIFLAALIVTATASGQEEKEWSLEECIAHAHQNNITVKQQELNLKNKVK